MPDGIAALSDAFHAALEENPDIEFGGSDWMDEFAAPKAQPAEEATQPEAVEQAAEEANEQPAETEAPSEETADDDVQSLLDEGLDDEEASTETAQAGVVPGSEEFWNLTIEKDGETVTLRQLYEGGLRQADYTRKTQEVAEQRKALGQAAEFYEQFSKDPVGFARTLAVRAGLMTGEDPAPDSGPRFYSPEEINRLVEEQVEQRLNDHPVVKDAALVQAQTQLRETFDRLEQDRGVQLSPENRRRIAQEAVRMGVGDVSVAYDVLVARRMQERSKRASVKSAAPLQPREAAPTSTEEKPRVPKTPKEAFEMALAGMAGAAQ